MSEQAMRMETEGARERAIQYLTVRQGKRFYEMGKGEKNVKTGIVPPVPKVERTTPLVETVTAFEEVIDKMGEKGYVGAQKFFENVRPVAYDGLRVFQWTTRAADFAVTAAMLFWPTTQMENNRNVAKGNVLLSTKWSSEAAGNFMENGNMKRLKKALTYKNPKRSLMDAQPFKLMRTNPATEILAVAGMWRFRPIEWVGAKAIQLGGKVITSDLVAPIVNNILGGGERVEKKPLPFSGTKPITA